MALNITKTTVASNVRAGTVVGVLTATQGATIIPCTFTLEGSPNNYFAISGNDLVTAQSGPLLQGEYPVKVAATPIPLSVFDNITITVTASPPPPPLPTPVSITVTPFSVSFPDNTLSGAQIASISITTSDGSPFSGTLAVTPADFLTVVKQSVVLSRALTPHDEGARECDISATQNGKSISATLTVEVTMPYRQPPQP
jgi:hypothetical protein